MSEKTDQSFKEKLIYSDISQDTLRVAYREYKGDFARPAFFQELTYDLSNSNEIAFRDFRLEILKADNSKIEYRVLAD